MHLVVPNKIFNFQRPPCLQAFNSHIRNVHSGRRSFEYERTKHHWRTNLEFQGKLIPKYMRLPF